MKKIFIYKLFKIYQFLLWKIGIAWHDNKFNECTPDFNCCCRNAGRKAFLKFKDKNSKINY